MKDEVSIEKHNGEWTTTSRQRMADIMGKLPDGKYMFYVPHRKTAVKNSRYKYYFDCFLYSILSQLRGRVFFVDSNTDSETQGEVIPISTTSQLHEFFKLKYNRGTIMDTVTKKAYDIPLSTTGLSNTDFINKFQEEIAADMATEYGCEIISFEEYIQHKEDGTWHEFKEALKG